ncbi:hypothetical protein EDC04DRAFT_2800956 [Pisolithus marmoratus]|nr:hypothetical protein EDC04DRAFT_2800956 [Pisolithus marmoratus]
MGKNHSRAQGVISGIVLDPQEPPLEKETTTVQLQRPPLYVLVKSDRTRSWKLHNLEESIILVEPATRDISHRIKTKQWQRSHYRSQGQTLSCVIRTFFNTFTVRFG